MYYILSDKCIFSEYPSHIPSIKNAHSMYIPLALLNIYRMCNEYTIAMWVLTRHLCWKQQ